MASHHPPRHCFTELQFQDAELTVLATFTEHPYIYNFTFAESDDYAAWKANPNGAFFNATVRNAGTATFERQA